MRSELASARRSNLEGNSMQNSTRREESGKSREGGALSQRREEGGEKERESKAGKENERRREKKGGWVGEITSVREERIERRKKRGRVRNSHYLTQVRRSNVGKRPPQSEINWKIAKNEKPRLSIFSSKIQWRTEYRARLMWFNATSYYAALCEEDDSSYSKPHQNAEALQSVRVSIINQCFRIYQRLENGKVMKIKTHGSYNFILLFDKGSASKSCDK